MARGNVTRLSSQVMMGGGWALILQENLATEPSVTTMDVGWIAKEEIPAAKQNRQIKFKTLYVCKIASQTGHLYICKMFFLYFIMHQYNILSSSESQ